MERYSIILNGKASNWYVRELKQVEQIARKELYCSYKLWSYLKRTGAIRYNKQVLKDGKWEYVESNRILK